MQLVEPQLVPVVVPFGHRQTCDLAHGVHVVPHVIHMAAMALVILVVHVRSVVRRLLVIVTLVTGVSGMVWAVAHVVVIAMILGRLGRRLVVVRTAVVLVAVSLGLAVGMVARPVRRSRAISRRLSHRLVAQVSPRHVERVYDLAALPEHDAHSGLRHRPFDAVQPRRVLRGRGTTHDKQIGGGRSTH
jgi:hypothetical protein